MGELYKLNKDELIYLVLNLKENLTEDELENELKKRKNIRKLHVLKTSLVNLKVVPYLKDFIENNEEFIKTRKNVRDFCNGEFYKEFRNLRILKDANLNGFIYFDENLGIENSKVVYEPCKKCNYYEIHFYKGEMIWMRDTNSGTSIDCPDHLNVFT